MGHGYHHSGSHSPVKHEDRGHDDHDRQDHHHDEFRKDSVPSRYSSPSPTHSRVSSYKSPERVLVLKPKKESDVLENMESSFTDGPLETLKNCVHDGRKVMVWIRNHNGIRGICSGFVLAFDKFWNLLMQDVDEVYQKSRYPKTPFLQSVKESSHLPEASLVKKKKPTEQSNPKVVKDVEMSESARQEARERKKKRKEEGKKKRAQERAALCKRNVKKMFIRGDNVVFIRVCV